MQVELTRDSHTLAQAYFEAWSRQDVAGVLDLFADEFIFEDVATELVSRSKSDVAAYAQALFVAIPDARFDPTRTWSSGSIVSTQWRFTGTMTGPLRGEGPTHAHVDHPGATVFDILDGKIVSCVEYWNHSSFLRQLGLTVR